MNNAKAILDQYFLEMRWRCLSLAADLDRVERGVDGDSVINSDSRVKKLRQAIQLLLDAKDNRAEQVEKLFSDMSPPPER